MNKPSDDIINQLKNAFAGGCAGLISSAITCPLDMIKIRLQNRPSGQKPMEVFKDIWKNEGIRGLYRGVYPTIAGYLPTWAIYFLVYDSTKKFYKRSIPTGGTTFYNVMAALHAGVVSTTMTNPLWVVRTRIMTQPLLKTEGLPYFYSSTADALKTILEKEGWRALYKGLGPSLLGVSHVVIQFPIYEHLKTGGIDGHHVNPPSSLWILASSAISKMVASSITYPHEVIRTRLHTQTVVEYSQADTRYIYDAPPSKPKYKGIVPSVLVIFKEEGWRGFYKGFGINLIRTVPASALTILTYELVRNAI